MKKIVEGFSGTRWIEANTLLELLGLQLLYQWGGVLGVRRLREWNIAFMAKLGWKMLTNTDKLWVRIFNEKYLKRTSFFFTVFRGPTNPRRGGIS